MAWTNQEKYENATRFMGGNRPMGKANTNYAEQIAASSAAFDKYHGKPSNSGTRSSSSSTANVSSAPAVSAPAATGSSGNDWYSEALRAQQRARQRAYDAAAAAQRQQ